MKSLRTLPLLGLLALAGPRALAHESASQSRRDIVDTAVAAGNFKTLAAALGAAELVDALKSKGPFTVFAPTDEAFATLDPDVLKSLLKPENRPQLVRILKYHVVPARVSAAQAISAGKARTLSGDEVAIELSGGRLKVGGAAVLANDIAASNGVIHVIDTVLLPPAPEGDLSIGAETDFVGGQLATYLGLGSHAALLVESVRDGCPLRAGDVIVAIDGNAYQTGLLTRTLEAAGYGGAVSFTVLRRGQKDRVEVRCAVGVE